jgi:proteasome accessory factor A
MELSQEIDWVIKLNFILSYMERKGCSWNDPRVSMIDLQYHNVDRNKGIYYLLEKGGFVKRILKDEEILNAKDMSPKDTRSYFRGMCINRFYDSIYAVSWSSIIFDLKDNTLKKILLLEPLKGNEYLTKEIFDRSNSIEDLLKKISNKKGGNYG